MTASKMYLSSYQLRFPRLVFDYGLTTQISRDPMDGMRRFGPYDKRQPRKNPIRCAIVFPRWARNEAQRVLIAFRDGMFHFRGFSDLSRGIKIAEFSEHALDIGERAPAPQQSEEYRQSLEPLRSAFADIDLVFVLLPTSTRFATDAPYAVAKVFFSKLGIPTQMIGANKVQNDEAFKWSLGNIALACYAKLGNIPWVIEDTGGSDDLIIGFGKRELREGRLGEIRRYFGFTTAYRNNGAFVTFQGLSPARTMENVGEQLEDAINTALGEYAKQQTGLGSPVVVPDRVILHSFKRIGPAEVTALENATRSVGKATSKQIQYLLVHIEESESLYMFDTGDRTYLPEAGQVVKLGRRQAILLSEGRERYKKRKIGFPHPFRVTLDERSQVNGQEYDVVFEELLKQVFSLSKINWRGFNAASIPVTLNYSRLLAEVAGFCREDEDWQAIVEQERLKDKAWFL